LTVQTKEAQERAEANFRKKEQQAREASKAMAEYQAALRAERDKTVRLKQLREAKLAADAAAAAAGREVKSAPAPEGKPVSKPRASAPRVAPEPQPRNRRAAARTKKAEPGLARS
jgi:hypothetical protein